MKIRERKPQNILDKIVADKQREVDFLLGHIEKEALQKRASDQRIPLDFRARLSGARLSIIAEVKKASPSKGLIRPDFDPVGIAQAYHRAGADAISILTEKKYFQGDPSYLSAIKQVADCPLLRKDFIVDRRQIRESYDIGADAILLIVSVLTDDQLRSFKLAADSFGLSSLVEIHSEEELERALGLGFELIGINNRNLETFETHLSHSFGLVKKMPASLVKVSESGIKKPDDCLRLQEAGFHAVLVGETLMRENDPGFALKHLMSKVR